MNGEVAIKLHVYIPFSSEDQDKEEIASRAYDQLIQALEKQNLSYQTYESEVRFQ
jgi:DNA-binding LacI/PurR family transcriptional regulator